MRSAVVEPAEASEGHECDPPLGEIPLCAGWFASLDIIPNSSG